MDDKIPPEVKALIDDVVKLRYKDDNGVDESATNSTGLFGSFFSTNTTSTEKINQQDKDKLNFKKKVSEILNHVHIKNIFHKNKETKYRDNNYDDAYFYIFKSTKFVNLESERIKKIIENAPINYTITSTLAGNSELGKIVDFYPLIKCIILKDKDCGRYQNISILDNNPSMKEALSQCNETEVKTKIIETAFFMLTNENDPYKHNPIFCLWENNKKDFKKIINLFSSSKKKVERSEIIDAINELEKDNFSFKNLGNETIVNDFVKDLKGIRDELYKISSSPVTQKLIDSLDYGDVYKQLIEKTEADIHKKYLSDNQKNIKEHEKLKKEHQDYLKIRNDKKELKQDLKDIDALCNASEARLAEIEAKLPPKYQRYTVTQFAIAMTGKAVLKMTDDDNLANTVKGFINKRIYKQNFQQAFDNMSVFSEETRPAPEQNFTEKQNIHEAIAKIQTPLQRFNSILPELTADNITTVSDEVLGRLFDTSAIMAACDVFDIDERFKPLVKSLEIMPDNKFDCNSVVNHERIFVVTDLIKDSLRLGRGDIAIDLITHFIPKINDNNPELMRDTSELSNSFRQELSDITALSVELSKVDTRLKPVDKRKPLEKLLELTQAIIIPEFTSYDPTEPMDIPVTGHLPEIIDSTLHDLRQGETETLKSLIKHATDTNPDLVVKGNDIFNGQDKKIFSLMLEKLRRSLNPNPLNEVMSDFLTLYTAGHFAEGGGFSDTANDGQTQPLRLLDRLTNAVSTQTRYNDEPTILERLESKPAFLNEIIGNNPNNHKCDFKKAYRQENGDINRMKIRFNQHAPKPFIASITQNMARHRFNANLGNL